MVRMAIMKSLQITNTEEGMEKREPSYTIGWNVSWCTTMENSMEFHKKLKIELPYDQTILLLGIYPEKN